MDFQKAEAYYKQGMENLNLKQYEEAIEDFNKAIGINSKYIEAYHDCGSAKLKLGNKEQDPQKEKNYYEEAVKDFDEVIKINSEYAPAYNNRSIARLMLGSKEPNQNQQKIKDYYTKAIEDYDKAIKINPQNAQVYIDSGIAKLVESARAKLKDKPTNNSEGKSEDEK